MTTSLSSSNINAFWGLLFRYLRTLGRSHHDAEDLTQEVFRHLAARRFFDRGGRHFGSEAEARNYLYASARNVLRDQQRRRTALKRGGQNTDISLDDDEVIENMPPFNHTTTPAEEAEWHEAQKHWDDHIEVLASEATTRGKRALFVLLRDSLNPCHGTADLKQAAKALGMNPATVRVQASRWRAAMIARVRATMVTSEAA